jgi:hypothetical protein
LRCVRGGPSRGPLPGVAKEALNVESMFSQPPLSGGQLDLPEQLPIPRKQHEGLDAHFQSAAGANMKDLAAAHGIHRVTVSEIIRRAGVPTRQRGLDPGQVERAVRLYVEGWSLARLGERFGVAGATVWRALRGRGVVMRPPRENKPRHTKIK